MKDFPIVKLISLSCVLAAVLIAIVYIPQSSFFPRSSLGPLLHAEKSKFSTIRVRGDESKRHLVFVSDAGMEQLQSSIDLENPGALQVAYTKTLFASHLVKHPQDRVLIVGLGGGGMVRFIEQNLPGVAVEAVEIDPAVVRIAADYFETRESDRVKIFTEDAFEFLARKQDPYDVIYLDAFLRPSVDKEADGKTARLKTVAFLETIRGQLEPDGVLAVNLISYRKTTPGDIESLREVFPTVLEIPVAGTGNLVVLASATEVTATKDALVDKGKSLEKALPAGLSFSEFAKQIRESSGR